MVTKTRPRGVNKGGWDSSTKGNPNQALLGNQLLFFLLELRLPGVQPVPYREAGAFSLFFRMWTLDLALLRFWDESERFSCRARESRYPPISKLPQSSAKFGRSRRTNLPQDSAKFVCAESVPLPPESDIIRPSNPPGCERGEQGQRKTILMLDTLQEHENCS